MFKNLLLIIVLCFSIESSSQTNFTLKSLELPVQKKQELQEKYEDFEAYHIDLKGLNATVKKQKKDKIRFSLKGMNKFSKLEFTLSENEILRYDAKISVQSKKVTTIKDNLTSILENGALLSKQKIIISK